MIRLLLLTSILFLFSACVNKRGVSATYYNECDEYYDLQGTYHKECDDNVIEFEDIKDAFKTKEEDPTTNVW